MKKRLLVICAVAMFALAGCGGDSKDSAETTKAPVENQSENNNTSDVPKSEYMTDDKGYVFSVSGTEVAIHAPMKDIIATIGEPVSYFEAASCAFGDLDKTYTYGGYDINTYSLNGNDYVAAVIFSDDTQKTAEGISIGSSMEDVKAAYGEAELDGTALVYKKGAMKIQFFFTDNAVSGIQYLNTVLD